MSSGCYTRSSETCPPVSLLWALSFPTFSASTPNTYYPMKLSYIRCRFHLLPTWGGRYMPLPRAVWLTHLSNCNIKIPPLQHLLRLPLATLTVFSSMLPKVLRTFIKTVSACKSCLWWYLEPSYMRMFREHPWNTGSLEMSTICCHLRFGNWHNNPRKQAG